MRHSPSSAPAIIASTNFGTLNSVTAVLLGTIGSSWSNGQGPEEPIVPGSRAVYYDLAMTRPDLEKVWLALFRKTPAKRGTPTLAELVPTASLAAKVCLDRLVSSKIQFLKKHFLSHWK